MIRLPPSSSRWAAAAPGCLDLRRAASAILTAYTCAEIAGRAPRPVHAASPRWLDDRGEACRPAARLPVRTLVSCVRRRGRCSALARLPRTRLLCGGGGGGSSSCALTRSHANRRPGNGWSWSSAPAASSSSSTFPCDLSCSKVPLPRFLQKQGGAEISAPPLLCTCLRISSRLPCLLPASGCLFVTNCTPNLGVPN